jgi:hypothetical protein
MRVAAPDGELMAPRWERLPVYRELAHVLRRREGLIGVEGLLLLARAEGLSDQELRNLVASWGERPWPPR